MSAAPVNVAERIANRPVSVPAALRDRVAKSSSIEAFRFPDANEQWHSLTWQETLSKVEALANGLLALGLEREQRVAIASGTRIEWILADLAIGFAGGVTTTVYPNTTADEVQYILDHSESRVVIVENVEQLEKMRRTGLEFDSLILIDGTAEGAVSWDDLVAQGEAYAAEHPDALDEIVDSLGLDSLCTLIYTSGTTGRPKGVELTHGNWTYEGTAMDTLDIVTENDLQYLWLPLSHVFGKCLIACQIIIGFASAVDGRIPKIVPNLSVVHPTFMCGAPRIFEKVRVAVLTGNKGIKGQIARWAFGVGAKSRPYRLEGKSMPALLKAQYGLAHKLVFSKLHEKMGGRLRFFISGSAKLNAQVQAWFYSAGLTVVEGYGMTETSAISTLNDPRTPLFGTIGKASPGTEVRIADDGEVLIKGPGVMRGYHKNPEKTAEAIQDGWYGTGDVGEMDAEGNVTITDRKRDLFKTSGGKFIAPQKVEGVIMANCPYLSQIVVLGEGRKYAVALVTMDEPQLLAWGEKRGLKADYAELSQHPDIRESIKGFIDRANERLDRWETVKDFAILDHELTVEDGQVTANMKIRRGKVAETYADVVESLYPKED